MSKVKRGLGLAHEERKIRDRERWEAERGSRVNRAKLDPEDPFVYIVGPVVYDRGRDKGKEVTVSLYAFDLLALEELWEEDGGLLVPKEGAGLLRDAHGRVLNEGTNEGLRVRPYLVVQSSYSEQQEVLEKAVEGRLAIDYEDKPMGVLPPAKVFSNSLFDADGLGRVEVSQELRPDLEKKVNLIKCFYDRLKSEK